VNYPSAAEDSRSAGNLQRLAKTHKFPGRTAPGAGSSELR